jgi:hypothetical protein
MVIAAGIAFFFLHLGQDVSYAIEEHFACVLVAFLRNQTPKIISFLGGNKPKLLIPFPDDIHLPIKVTLDPCAT